LEEDPSLGRRDSIDGSVHISNDASFLFVRVETDEANPLLFSSVNVNAAGLPHIVTQNDGKRYNWDGSDCAPDPRNFGVKAGEMLFEQHDSYTENEDSSAVSEFLYTIPLSDLPLHSGSGCTIRVMVYVEAEKSGVPGNKASLWALDDSMITFSASDVCPEAGYFGVGEYTLCGIPQCEKQD
jgi:hypothetical protein